MRKYQFPLQTALDLRGHQEDQAQRRMARAQRLVRDRRSDLERTLERHDALVSGLRGDGGAGASVAIGEVEHTWLVLAELRRRLTHQRQRLADAERECEQRRAELIEASQARRTLERLSERREAEHLREETQREQRELNEAAISRHRVGVGAGLGRSLIGDLDNVA